MMRQDEINGFADANTRLMTAASFRTIMARQIFGGAASDMTAPFWGVHRETIDEGREIRSSRPGFSIVESESDQQLVADDSGTKSELHPVGHERQQGRNEAKREVVPHGHNAVQVASAAIRKSAALMHKEQPSAVNSHTVGSAANIRAETGVRSENLPVTR
jgi:hypothetical protein